MSSFKRKMQRQIQKNNGTLLHKKVVARKMGCKSVEEYNRKEAKCTNTAELQEELGVSRRTLRTDIAYLKRVYPDKLITHRGRYTGGLEWVE